jgi:hypothetical protein
MIRFACAAALVALTALSSSAAAQEYRNRGDLDSLYCDDHGDLVADTPKTPRN